MDTGTRWTAERKAAVVRSVRRGEITLGEVGRRHGISQEEFDSWSARYDAYGHRGLKATKTQECRTHLPSRDELKIAEMSLKIQRQHGALELAQRALNDIEMGKRKGCAAAAQQAVNQVLGGTG